MSETGLIDEHQSRTSEPSASDYEPTAEERKTIKMVEKLFDKAKRHRALYDAKWLDFYHMFRGKQWKEQRPSYRHTEVINFVFRVIQSLVPIQTDSRPRFEHLPEEPSDIDLAEIMNEMAESDWQKKNWQETLLEVVYDAHFFGAGLSEVCIDEDKVRRGINDIVYKSVDPFHCFPDPDATDCNKECGFFITAVPTEVAKIKKRYPDHKDAIKPDLMDLMKGEKTDLQPLKFRSPVDRRSMVETGQSFDLVDKDKALLITAWLTPEQCEEDYEELDKSLRDPETGSVTPQFEQVAKYPNGRRVVLCNGVLLADDMNPYEDGKIPLQRLVNYTLPREFWGISEVEQLEGPQRVFNKLFSFALDVLTLMGNPIWKVPTSAMIDPENLMNRPGLVVEYDGDKAPEREEGVALQPYVLQLADKVAEYVDSLSGSQDVSRGVQPTGVTAASAISALQEASNTRIRLKARIMDGNLQQVGMAWDSRVFQFRTAPEVFRLTNKQDVTKYFRAHVEPYTDEATGEQKRRMRVQPYAADETGRATGGYDPTQEQVFEIRGKMDLRVSTGSSLPFNKAEKEQKLLAYFDRGIIDQEEVLKGSEYPNYQLVLQRMQQAAQAKADAEAQAAMAQKAPAAPPAPAPAA